MTVLKYWDQASGTYKAVSGPPGPANPYIVVTNLTTNPPNVNNPPIQPPQGLLVADTSVPDPTTTYLPVTGGAVTGPLTAPTPAAGDSSQSVATTAFVAPAWNDVGRNKIMNGQFRIQQRGAGPWTVGGSYLADRWAVGITSDTTTVSCAAVTDAHRAGIGDDDLGPSILSCGVTGNAAAGAYTFLTHGIEDVARLAGKTVTLSFWSQCSVTNNVGLRLTQQFGTGGSPSAQVSVPTQTITELAGSAWKRFSLTFTLPTIQGKVIGTNNDHRTLLQVAMSSGSTNSPSLGVGVQSGTFNFWGFQLEIGSVMTPLEKIDYALELVKCQRFYQIGAMSLYAYNTAGSYIAVGGSFPVPMRVSPTFTTNFSQNSNSTGTTFAMLGANPNQWQYWQLYCTATATGPILLSGSFTASADL